MNMQISKNKHIIDSEIGNKNALTMNIFKYISQSISLKSFNNNISFIQTLFASIQNPYNVLSFTIKFWIFESNRF